MRDSTNVVAPAPAPVPSATATIQNLNLVSMILGKKPQEHSSSEAHQDPNYLTEIPSPPKVTSITFDQENDWEGNQTITRERSPEAERTIRVRASFAGDEQTQIQMPSPMKFDELDESGNPSSENNFDDDAQQIADQTSGFGAPTTTFVLSRATLPDEDEDDLNDTFSERTITKLNPKWLPPATNRPQLIQPHTLRSTNASIAQASTMSAATASTDQEVDRTVVEETPMVLAQPNEIEETEIVLGELSDENTVVNTSGDSRSSITEDTEPSASESDTSQPEEMTQSDTVASIDETELSTRDKEVASREVDAALLRRRLPMKDALMILFKMNLPSMPKEMQSVAAIFVRSRALSITAGLTPTDPSDF